jgi:hypothetical protein
VLGGGEGWRGSLVRAAVTRGHPRWRRDHSGKLGSYSPNQLAGEHQELTVDSSEVTVGVEDYGGGLAACD